MILCASVARAFFLQPLGNQQTPKPASHPRAPRQFDSNDNLPLSKSIVSKITHLFRQPILNKPPNKVAIPSHPLTNMNVTRPFQVSTAKHQYFLQPDIQTHPLNSCRQQARPQRLCRLLLAALVTSSICCRYGPLALVPPAVQKPPAALLGSLADHIRFPLLDFPPADRADDQLDCDVAHCSNSRCLYSRIHDWRL